MDVFLCNAIVYILTFLVILIKAKGLNVYVLVWAAYTINAVCGYCCVVMDLHYTHDVTLGYKVSFVPYIFLYLCFHVISYPFYKFNVHHIDVHNLASSRFQKFINLSFFIYIVVSVVRVIEAILISQIGFGEAYEIGAETERRAMVFDNFLLIWISNLGNTFCTITQPILAFYFFYKLSLGKSPLKSIFNLAVVYLPSIAGNIAMSSKGGLFFLSLNILFIFVFFKESLSKKMQNILLLCGFFTGIIFWTLASSIQNGRNYYTNSREETGETLLRYMGESQPNLGYYYYGRPMNHPYGQRIIPFFSPKKFRSYNELNDYWEQYTKVPSPFFKTILGDCNVEFGFVGAIMFILSFVWVWRRYIFRNYQKFYYFPFICCYYQSVAVLGMMGFSRGIIESFCMLLLMSLYIKKLVK